MNTQTFLVLGLAGLISATGVSAGGMHGGGHAHAPKQGGSPMGDHGPAAHWMAPAAAAARENPVAATLASIARGSALYGQYCAACHGPEGHGDGPAGAALNAPPANLALMAPQHPAGDLAWKVAHGRGGMPAWKGVLKADQIWDLVNYMKTLGAGG